MRVRPMESRDLPAIREIYDAAGYSFDLPAFDSPLIEASDVVVDDSDAPMMGATAKRGIELFLFCAPGGNIHPLTKIEGIRLLHESIRDNIVAKGYDEAYAFLPPVLEKSHGRHLQHMFGWKPCWKAYVIRNWRG